MDVKECLEKGLLKQDKPSIEKAKRSIVVASSKLKKAGELIELGILDMSEIAEAHTLVLKSKASQRFPSMLKNTRDMRVSSLRTRSQLTALARSVFDMSQINCYSAMFHSARALLFKDGFKERSHYAVYVYLKEKYSDKIGLKFLNELNVLRLDRHEIFYGLEEITLDKDEIKKTIKLCEEFIANVKRLLF